MVPHFPGPKRRVAELLGEDIPEDEVLLMKNGRLCCVVCHHRPVFDTIQVLHVHRSGKKHQTHAEWFYADKNEVHNLIKKRQHEEFVRTGRIQTVGPREVSSVPGKAWLGCAPYDPRVKKQKAKPYLRKPVVQLGPPTNPLEAEGTSLSSLPGYHGYIDSTDATSPKMPQTIAEYRHLQSKTASLGAPLKPYISKSRPNTSQPWQQTRNECNSSADRLRTQPCQIKNNNQTSKSFFKGGGTGSHKQPERCRNSGDLDSQYTHKTKGHSKEKNKTIGTPVLARNDDKLQKAEKYLMARGAGWKKDWTGKWIKDEDAEFDSDEEPPDLP